MAKKTSSGGSNFQFPGWLVGAMVHIAASAAGIYKCRQPGCSGALGLTFKCKVCGRRGFPRFGSV